LEKLPAYIILRLENAVPSNEPIDPEVASVALKNEPTAKTEIESR
jgi:hypothetical protein